MPIFHAAEDNDAQKVYENLDIKFSRSEYRYVPTIIMVRPLSNDGLSTHGT